MIGAMTTDVRLDLTRHGPTHIYLKKSDSRGLPGALSETVHTGAADGTVQVGWRILA